jgi:hypothetical protein
MSWLTLNAPDNSLQAWAHGYALAELAEEDERFAAYAQDAELQQEMAEKFKAMGKHPDRCASNLVNHGQPWSNMVEFCTTNITLKAMLCTQC